MISHRQTVTGHGPILEYVYSTRRVDRQLRRWQLSMLNVVAPGVVDLRDGVRVLERLPSHIYEWLTRQRTRKERQRRENDGRWYVLLSDRVDLGVGDKMSAFDVNFWLHSRALNQVVCELICHWRIRKLQRCIERLEQSLLGGRRQGTRSGHLRKQRIIQKSQIELFWWATSCETRRHWVSRLRAGRSPRSMA